jgi:predicted TIM-barrel fold metal-dependent hydrolase
VRKHADWTPEIALRLLERAAPHAQVQDLDPGADAIVTIERAIEERKVDEVIVSTAPTHLAKWLRRDLAHRVKRLGLPVTLIPPEVDSADTQRSLQAVEAGLPVFSSQR